MVHSLFTHLTVVSSWYFPNEPCSTVTSCICRRPCWSVFCMSMSIWLCYVSDQFDTCTLCGYLSVFHYLNFFHLSVFCGYPAVSLLAHRTAPAVQIIETPIFLSPRTGFVSDYRTSIRANFLCSPAKALFSLCDFSVIHYFGLLQHWHYIHQCIQLCSAGLIFWGTMDIWRRFILIYLSSG